MSPSDKCFIKTLYYSNVFFFEMQAFQVDTGEKLFYNRENKIAGELV